MLERWRGAGDVELVIETSATITAENMARTLPLLIERDVREATLVCGALHLPRVRYFFGSVYPRYGIRCTYAPCATCRRRGRLRGRRRRSP